MSIKITVEKLISTNPNRYAIDGGELNLINDIAKDLNYPSIEIPHYKLIQSVHRLRNKYLETHKEVDFRTSNKPDDRVEVSIFELEVYRGVIDTVEADKTQRVVNYISQNEDERLKQTNSRIAKSVRGVSKDEVEHIKRYYHLFEDLMNRNTKVKVTKTDS